MENSINLSYESNINQSSFLDNSILSLANSVDEQEDVVESKVAINDEANKSITKTNSKRSEKAIIENLSPSVMNANQSPSGNASSLSARKSLKVMSTSLLSNNQSNIPTSPLSKILSFPLSAASPDNRKSLSKRLSRGSNHAEEADQIQSKDSFSSAQTGNEQTVLSPTKRMSLNDSVISVSQRMSNGRIPIDSYKQKLKIPLSTSVRDRSRVFEPEKNSSVKGVEACGSTILDSPNMMTPSGSTSEYHENTLTPGASLHFSPASKLTPFTSTPWRKSLSHTADHITSETRSISIDSSKAKSKTKGSKVNEDQEFDLQTLTSEAERLDKELQLMRKENEQIQMQLDEEFESANQELDNLKREFNTAPKIEPASFSHALAKNAAEFVHEEKAITDRRKDIDAMLQEWEFELAELIATEEILQARIKELQYQQHYISRGKSTRYSLNASQKSLNDEEKRVSKPNEAHDSTKKISSKKRTQKFKEDSELYQKDAEIALQQAQVKVDEVFSSYSKAINESNAKLSMLLEQNQEMQNRVRDNKQI